MKIFDSIINEELKNNLKDKNELKPALFLDRDGVIIKDCHYISNPKDVELEDHVLELIKFVKSNNWLIIIITNQSGISKGILDWNSYKQVTKKMIDLFGVENPFAAIYANGVSSEILNNKWRKPSPGMIKHSINDFPIDLKKSIIIGDRLTDIQAGARANLFAAFHVLTGHGKKERKIIKKSINNEGIFVDYKNSINITLVNSLKDIPTNIFKSRN